MNVPCFLVCLIVSTSRTCADRRHACGYNMRSLLDIVVAARDTRNLNGCTVVQHCDDGELMACFSTDNVMRNYRKTIPNNKKCPRSFFTGMMGNVAESVMETCANGNSTAVLIVPVKKMTAVMFERFFCCSFYQQFRMT